MMKFTGNYRQGSHRYIYRDRLLDMHRRTFGDDQPAQQGDPEDDLLNDLNNSTSINSTVFIGNTQLYPTIEVDLAHVGEYDTALLGLLQTRPATVLPVFETAAADALKSFFGAQQQQQRNQQPQDMNSMDVDTTPTAQGELPGYTSIQILIKGNLKPTSLRSINASHMHKLLRCPGIVIQAARIHSRASRIRVRCSRCSHTVMLGGSSSTNSKSNLEGGPFSTISIPNNCLSQTPEECGPRPYAVIPDESQFVDQQTLKLQENPENVPTGEMPRSILLACERSLVDRAPPGTRVSIIAIASMFNNSSAAGQNNKSVYLRVVGMQRENAGDGSASGSDITSFTKAEEEAFRLLSKRSDVYTILYKSIAPSISGSYTIDIKKAMTCMLFGGSRKKLPDKMRLRGDINVLLLGDPSTAKSQFLKFMQRVAPIAVYTSGKGSSAAGLTASVIKDPRGEFYLEGGAMVLADGGIVCIDEFDKMRPADRVAIHEAMEQQTISVAKAGITTVLNSRTAVLAAANPVYGRYDDLKSASENIDLMTTILSRFDMIFLVRDVRDEDRDRAICRHVMGVHMNSRQELFSGNSMGSGSNGAGGGGSQVALSSGIVDDFGTSGVDLNNNATSPESIAENAMKVATSGGELNISTMKKYVQYCKSRCSPRLSEEAGDVLASAYVKIRDDVRKASSSGGNNADADNQAVIPITVRQLEALVRFCSFLYYPFFIVENIFLTHHSHIQTNNKCRYEYLKV